MPALLRGIYAYHTQSRGWRDIGYNFLVDRFGRIWEGRYGGVDRAVVGAHTLGYNEVSFAMSAIGNFDIAAPPQAVLDAYARLFAWKLSLYNIRADATRALRQGPLPAGHQRPPRRRPDRLPGALPLRQDPLDPGRGPAHPERGQSGTPAPRRRPRRRPPRAGDPGPDGSPRRRRRRGRRRAAAGLAFPRSMNLAGAANPDLVLKSRTGAIQVLPDRRPDRLRPAGHHDRGLAAMDLIAAVGDVTGDGKGDVLGRRQDRRRPGSTPATAPVTCPRSGIDATTALPATPT